MNLSGLRVVVMGLGQFGGGVGVTRFLVSRGAKVLVTDQAPAEKLKNSVSALDGLPVDFRLGEHRENDFANADLIVVNPAVKPHDNVFLKAAAAANVPLTSEMRLFLSHLPEALKKRTIGITGTAGKSTTTAMIGHVLKQKFGDEKIHIGGNIGGSLLGELDALCALCATSANSTPASRDVPARPTSESHAIADHWIVLELSSFMLMGLREDHWSPHVALLTNVAPNHLDWHSSFEEYQFAKRAIFDFQTGDDIAIVRESDATAMGLDARQIAASGRKKASVITLKENSGDTFPGTLLIPGAHNRINAAMALAAVLALPDAKISQHEALESLACFPGLSHRLSFVCEHRGVRYFNDSKATTPEATMLAMQSFDAGKIHIILGGYDKHADMAPMAKFASQHCKSIYTIGQTGPDIATATTGGSATVFQCDTLDKAVEKIITQVRDGDVVLLSPACASWGQFTNYEERGSRFAQAVLKYTGEGSPATF